MAAADPAADPAARMAAKVAVDAFARAGGRSVAVRVEAPDLEWSSGVPFEYPAAWLRSGTALNEAYAVRLLLQNTRAFRVVLWNSSLHAHHRDKLAAQMPLTLAGHHPTGGIWLRREE